MTISGPTPDRPTYESDLKRSIDLFEKSFQNVQTSQFDAQKDQYVKVMHESLKTIQESASGLLNSKIREMKEQLSQDLDTYLASPTDETKEKVQKDISQIKREV